MVDIVLWGVLAVSLLTVLGVVEKIGEKMRNEVEENEIDERVQRLWRWRRR